MANYTDPVKFTSTNNYGCGPQGEDDVYTVEEFKTLCENGAFIDYDGFGCPVKDSKADPSFFIYPSRVVAYPNPRWIPEDATHVVWYNR